MSLFGGQRIEEKGGFKKGRGCTEDTFYFTSIIEPCHE